jgi:Flp pilus assembly protein TadG
MRFLSANKSIARAAGPEAGRSTKGRRSGAATVEFALLTPFLFFLVLGTFEVARGIMIKQLLNDAARKACRTGVLPGKSDSDITAAVNNIMSDNNLPTSDVTIVIMVGSEAGGLSGGSVANSNTARPGLDFVSVKVSIPTSKIFWAGTLFLTSSTIESETVVMLRQG